MSQLGIPRGSSPQTVVPAFPFLSAAWVQGVFPTNSASENTQLQLLPGDSAAAAVLFAETQLPHQGTLSFIVKSHFLDMSV